jgi:hypothetical protein
VTSQLVGSDFSAAEQLPNYVNGRLLTAADLATGQNTLRARDTRVAQAAGHGVVHGLWVTLGSSTLSVAPGLGIGTAGEPVTVATDVTLPLTFTTAAGPAVAASFTSCCTVPTGSSAQLAIGCYLLVASPASQLTGSTPLAAPPDSTAPAGCTAQWQLSGVQFTAISLAPGTSVGGIDIGDGNRRNLIAHWCFGTDALAKLPLDPFAFSPTYGGLDGLADLPADAVPLATFYWDGQQVAFVDNWSARRRITAPDPVTASWSAVVSDRRIADGIARFLQFQNQVDELIVDGSSGGTAAPDVFGLLPPVGFLPWAPQYALGVFDALNRYRIEDERPADTAAPGDVVLVDQAVAAQEPVAETETPILQEIHDFAVRRLASQVSRSFIDIIGTRLGALGTKPGFDAERFFGRLGRFGGFIEWDVADMLLRQSWERAPQPTTVLTSVGGIKGEAPQTPLTYYGVIESMTGTVSTSFGRFPGDADYATLSRYRSQVSSRVQPPYLVFVRNYHCQEQTIPPILTTFPSWAN